MPDPLDDLRQEIARAPLHDFLRVEAVDVDADAAVTVRMRFRPEFRRTRDTDGYHGGVLAALVDLTAHAAVAARPTAGMELRAIRRIFRLGGSLAWADVEVWAGQDRMVAAGRGTFQVSRERVA